jgi:uncharacterized protein (DUF2164 family)
MEITLTKDVEKKLTASIKRFVSENLETDIGELQSSLFLKFCVEEIGPAIYNQAIADAQTYMQEKALNMENSCFAPDSAYWAKHDKISARRKSGR